MSLPIKLDAIELLPHTPASDVKKLGWRGVMKAIGRSGKVVVTNHNAPEAVILSVQEYGQIMQALEQSESNNSSALEMLRARFDQRLEALRADDAGERLRTLTRTPAALGGKLKAGATY